MSEATGQQGTPITELVEVARPEENDKLVIVRRDAGTGNFVNRQTPLPSYLTQESYNALIARIERLEEGQVRPKPPTTGTYWIGVSEDAEITEAELTVSSAGEETHALQVPEIADGQRRYIAYARPAAEGPFTFVYYYPHAHRDTNNRIMAWEQVANVTKNGVELVVMRTRGAYRGPIGVSSDDNTIRIVEAG